MQDIDYKLLLKQEPEFKKYVQDIILNVFSTEANFSSMVQVMHSFYMTGTTVEQTSQILISIMRGNRDDQN